MARQVGPENVVGRDRLLEQIWKKLENTSLRFTAERRIGKTTVMNKMCADPRDGMTPIFLDLEAIDSPTRFTEVLLTKLNHLLTPQQKATGVMSAIMETFGGTEIGGMIKLPEIAGKGWQAPLEGTIKSFCSNHPDTTVVLLFDELPYMLQKIVAKERGAGLSEHAALAVLDTLRSLRAECGNLRMIFAGSVGLHHVLEQLREAKLPAQPVNDMSPIEIEALDLHDAIALAEQLLAAEAVTVDGTDLRSFSEALAKLTDRVPFYLERVVARLAEHEQPVSIDTAAKIVGTHLTDDHDLWEMEHFRERLEIYYAGASTDTNGNEIKNAKLASTVLDILAVSQEELRISEIWDAVKAQIPLDERDQIIHLLRSLARDHYLRCDTDKRYSFRFPLVRRWWILAQGLST